MLNIEDIRKELGEYAFDDGDGIEYGMRYFIEKWAIKHFGRLPYLNQITVGCSNNGPNPITLVGRDAAESFKTDDEDDDEYLNNVSEKRNKIDLKKTLKNILKAYPDTIEYYAGNNTENVILFNEIFVYYDEIFYMNTPTIPDKIYDCVVDKVIKPKIRWVLRDNRGNIISKHMEVFPKGDIAENYNDDFNVVDEKIRNLIHSDESSIMILHGKPGTGKTSYIRDLIATNTDINFYWLDSSMFNYIDSSEFVEFIATCKNAVLVLEDSESLLASREDKANPAIQSLLSISDGMLGDSLKLKFICTFNTDLCNIDKAILRKGRMKVKYEFKDLETEKVKGIFRKIGIDENLARPMPICDAYNYLEDNCGTQEKRKIGF